MKRSIFTECLRIAREKNTPIHHPEWGHFHHFTFVIQNNKIVEWSTNRPAPFGSMIKLGYSEVSKIHSEVAAYSKAKGLLNDEPFDIINIRLRKNNDIAMSEPCPCCYNFLKNLGCKHMYFTTECGEFAKIITGTK